MKFKVGDFVRIRKDSEFYGDGESNPINSIGEVIISDQKDFPYVVKWENSYYNSYREEDLYLAPVDSKLNRVLYPELTSNGRGFLS